LDYDDLAGSASGATLYPGEIGVLVRTVVRGVVGALGLGDGGLGAGRAWGGGCPKLLRQEAGSCAGPCAEEVTA